MKRANIAAPVDVAKDDGAGMYMQSDIVFDFCLGADWYDGRWARLDFIGMSWEVLNPETWHGA